MEFNPRQLFPELDIKLHPSVYFPTTSDLQNNSYFIHLVDLIKEEYGHSDPKLRKHRPQVPYPLKEIQEFFDIRSLIAKVVAKAVPVKVPKGTVVYTLGAPPDEGYFLIHGCVELLAKKNSWQRLQSYAGHTLFNAEDRVDYLESNFNINPRHFEAVEPLFYEDRMSFGLLPFLKVYSGEYFGFKELVRGCMRTKMAIAVEDSLLVKVNKHEFDKYLKEFEEKREQYITNCMFQGTRQEILEDILHRIPVVFNSSELVKFDRDQTIFREGDLTGGLYFLLEGEVMESKDVKIEVPKKYLSNENQKEVIKQITIKLHKLVKNSFLGHIQPLMSLKHREFTCTCSLNGTLLLKLDAGAFLKAVSESVLFERELTLSAKHKYSVSSDNFLKHKSQVIKSYLSQFEQLDHKKKEKNIAGMLNNDVNFKQNGLYELFKKEGTFYRDTFERLQGFEEFEAKYDPKRSSINRHKIKSTIEQPQSNVLSTKKEPKIPQERSPSQEADVSFEATKKQLFSPGKATNTFEIFGPQFIQKLTPISEHNNSKSSLRKKRKNVTKFQQLKKDQTVFKRVLIKNGRYEVPRETNKSNIVAAIVNHKFDQVVKQCMSRKNIALRKVNLDDRKDLIKEEFKKTLSSLSSFPSKSVSMTRLGSTSFGFTCKGTEEMKRMLQKVKWSKSSTSSTGEKPSQDPKLEECIGYNQQPLSSEIKHRSALSSSKMSLNRSPEKIVLLNHMMKPITYTSAQI